MTRLFILLAISFLLEAGVEVGLDRVFLPSYSNWLKGKRVGLILNQTSINRDLKTAYEIFLSHHEKGDFHLVALFSPEHGLYGASSGEKVEDSVTQEGIPVYSLYGVRRRPTEKMLENLDVIVYDVQDIGSRSYTFSTTLYYVMEEASRFGVEVIVLDRPNPINGITVDGPMVEEGIRSFLSYINVPYCHGMTIGELATFFNEEYKVKCSLKVVWMKGWHRSMTFNDTGLSWIPPSPQIPKAETALFYPITGAFAELPLFNNGIWTTLPFELIGAPWIDPIRLKKALEKLKLPGVLFIPFHWETFKGRLANQRCHGLLLKVTDPLTFRPFTTGLAAFGLLKTLYPKQVKEGLTVWKNCAEQFSQVVGNRAYIKMIHEEPYATWKLMNYDKKRREDFLTLRNRYLYPGYSF